MSKMKRTFTVVAAAAGVSLGGIAISAGYNSAGVDQEANQARIGSTYDSGTTGSDSAALNQDLDTRTMGAGPAPESSAGLQGDELYAEDRTMGGTWDEEQQVMREPRIDRN